MNTGTEWHLLEGQEALVGAQGHPIHIRPQFCGPLGDREWILVQLEALRCL